MCAAGAVELMFTLLPTSSHPEVGLEAVETLNDLCSMSSNANKAASLGGRAVVRLTQLKSCNGDEFDGFVDKVLDKCGAISGLHYIRC